MKALLMPLLFLVFMSLHKITLAQYYNDLFSYEVSAGAGGMNCITDVGGSSASKYFYVNEMRLKNTKPCFTFGAAVIYQNLLGIRLEGTWGGVQSADADINGTSVNARSKMIRNLSFRSKVSEISLLAEFHPLLLFNFKNYPPRWSPYIMAGVGMFSFNPQAYLHGKYVDLAPLRTEGQGFLEYERSEPYATSQFNVPLGIGLRYELSDIINLRVEFSHRILFTDYLDDVHSAGYVDAEIFGKYLAVDDAINAQQLYNRSLDGLLPARRGNPGNNDTYMSMSFKIGFVLRRKARY